MEDVVRNESRDPTAGMAGLVNRMEEQLLQDKTVRFHRQVCIFSFGHEFG